MELAGLEKFKGRSLYAVGGVWQVYRPLQPAPAIPLHISCTATRMSQVEGAHHGFVMAQSRKTLERMAGVPRPPRQSRCPSGRWCWTSCSTAGAADR